jgi:tetratricopeptide (TPR) repeat protein
VNSDPLKAGQPEQSRQLAEDHYYAAVDLFSEGRHEEAVARYQQAIAADPTFTDAMHGLSRAYQDIGRFDEAIEVSEKIAAIDPEDTLAHTSLSILYQRKGMVPQAEAEANKARILGWKQELRHKRQNS